MKIALAQINTTVGDFAGNLERIREAARGVDASLVVFPELAVCGYMPRDLLEEPSFLDACERSLWALAGDPSLPPLLVGSPMAAPAPGKPLHNAAVLVRDGNLAPVAKRLLPIPAASAHTARPRATSPTSSSGTRSTSSSSASAARSSPSRSGPTSSCRTPSRATASATSAWSRPRSSSRASSASTSATTPAASTKASSREQSRKVGTHAACRRVLRVRVEAWRRRCMSSFQRPAFR